MPEAVARSRDGSITSMPRAAAKVVTALSRMEQGNQRKRCRRGGLRVSDRLRSGLQDLLRSGW